MDDRDLLQQFVTSGSADGKPQRERAFSALVARHINLVYSAARRQVGGNTSLAEDVTQSVFVLLAEKAATIREGEALAGWLLATTRFVALNALRSESRRRRYEREAAEMKRETQELAGPGDGPAWEAIGPMLDDAVAELKRDDRDALAMRFFEGLSAAEVGAAMGISTEAAQKRLTRAVERLRAFFQSRGVAASPEGLARVLSANACVAAPALLAARVAAEALSASASAASAGAATTSATSSAVGGVAIMAMTKAKLVLASTAAVLLAATMGAIAYQQMTGPPNTPRVVQLPPPPVAPTPVGNDWKSRFESIYRLRDGEVVKRIVPPFIPERLDFVRNSSSAEQLARFPNGPSRLLLEDDRGTLQWRSMSFGSAGRVDTTLESVIGIATYDLGIPSALLAAPLPGDWVRRSDVSRDQLIAAVAPAVAEAVGRSVTLAARPVERDVIAVSGGFEYRKLDDVPDAPNSEQVVHLFFAERLSEDDESGNRSGGTLRDLLDTLAQHIDCTIVVDGPVDPSREMVTWDIHRTAFGRDADNERDPRVVEAILKLLERQTSLELRRVRRPVPTWMLVDPGTGLPIVAALPRAAATAK